ncbi:uncharacterized protein NPIL_207801, partial [Nephila pilipes]
NLLHSDVVDIPSPIFPLAPKEGSRSPVYEDCSDATELGNCRKDAEEYQLLRNKRRNTALMENPLHSPEVTVGGLFTGSFIIRPLFFEIECPVNGWKTVTVNVQRYLTLLFAKGVPCLRENDALSTVTFLFPWSPRSRERTPADFWLRGCLKSQVYRTRPSNLSELKDVIRRVLSCIQTVILHSAVAGFETRLQCVISIGGGHVEHVLL